MGISNQRFKRRKKRRLWTRAVIILIVLAVSVFTVDYLLNFNRIYDGVSINELDIGGSRYGKAREATQMVAANLLATPVVLTYKDRSWELDPIEDMGATIDIEKTIKNAYQVGRRGNLAQRIQNRLLARREGTAVRLHLSLDEGGLMGYIETIAEEINFRPRSASLKENQVEFAVDGIAVDVRKTASRIREGLERVSGNRIEMTTLTLRPEVTSEELLTKLGFPDVLGAYSTTIKLEGDYADGKFHNIKLATKKINGVILQPGGTFSFNGLVGNGVYKDGFVDGLIISNGKLLPFEGGGICQVSTTIYNAALKVDAEITRRYNHSIHVDQTAYVPLGLGASVFGEIGKDFKFKNTYTNPVLIQAMVEGNILTTTIYGLKEEEKFVEITTADKEIIESPVEEIKDPTLEAGEVKVVQQGYDGYKVKVYRTVKVEGEIVKKELISSDTYKAMPTIVKVGTRQHQGG